jgi:hypothetical protein
MPFSLPSRVPRGTRRSVFVFCTTLYRPDTLFANRRIEHKSPAIWQFRKVFS